MSQLKEAPKPKAEVARPPGHMKATERGAPAAVPWETNPMAFMRRFAQETDRMFEEFGLRLPSFFGRGREMLRREVGLIPADWSPRVEIKEQEGRLFIRAELPGMVKDDVKVEVSNEVLTIHGERKQEKKEEHKGFSYSECSYGTFYRAIPLPEGVDIAKATAEFRNGVLEVVIPVPHAPEPKARRLEIEEKN